MGLLVENELCQLRTMRLQDKLTRLAAEFRFSQRDLAMRLPGVSTTTINRWLNGESEPRLRDALRLANLFGIGLEFLADDTMDDPSPALMTEDEAAIIDLYHALGLDRREAMKRLANAAVPSEGVSLGSLRDLTALDERNERERLEAIKAANRAAKHARRDSESGKIPRRKSS